MRSGTRTWIAIAAMMAAGLLAPAASSALVYCVPTLGAGCDVDSPDVQTALNAAAGSADADTVRVDPGIYSSAAGFSYNGTSDLNLDGAGDTQTTLTRPASAGGGPILQPGGGGVISISDLRLLIPTPSAGEQYRGLDTGQVLDLERIRVEAPTAFNGFGLNLPSGATIDDSTIDLTSAGVPPENIGLAIGGTPTVTDTSIEADYGVRIDGGNFTMNRSTIEAATIGIEASNGDASLSNSLIRAGATAIRVGNPNGTAAAESFALTADGLTLASREPDPTIGVDVFTNTTVGVIDDHSAAIRNTIFDPGLDTPISRRTDEASRAVVTTAYSNLNPAANLSTNDDNGDMNATGLGSISSLGGDVNVAPGFVNPAGGDYHLANGSPMIDAGDPALPAPGETDLDGAPRAHVRQINCGVPAGPTRRDIGADEFSQFTDPVAGCVNPFAPVPADPVKPKKCVKKKAKKRGRASAKKRKCKRKKKRTK
jgi:hypothetical protein